MRAFRLLFPMLAATTMGAAPAFADVKDGVDAWTRGDYPAAVKQWQGPAAKGDADAMFNMGQAYKLGRGVPRDPAKAEQMYRLAAEKGHARAADNYGILLFQTGRQAEAMRWISASAERGEPRAMYILGIAAYNGDYAQKDWVRAYALMTRAAASGLTQAVSGLATMNETIALEDRQKGAALAQELDLRTAEVRGRQLAAADLGAKAPPVPTAPLPPAPTAPLRQQAAPAPLQTVPLPAARTEDPGTAPTGPVMAGADYANPVEVPRMATATPKPAPQPKPAPAPKPAPKPATTPAPAPAPAPASGTYRIQLGAFGQKSNADALWTRLHTRPELTGHSRLDVGTGVTRLQAGGYTQAAAEKACAGLKAAGEVCLVVKP
ncbi:SPOR domain-containing protein [Novosphingobium cyanobacteriorum]|uniref:SPOR domain-containing protein n=1 Tax=Novosphingobium cyanobacteriorum TaxID=3024215 RepID=A0ABT6CMF1_9SPHN|nr:SPOR domain-containing protein [Novosphingobium cyanobacteriorum]MDF8334245.1 SPOR domain-containing protein [Novosphingobium cyanobacteriorum]